ncbi:bifunctional (p)ppGpp synthetase/guanosine-3',5'-bis(diphosphate) 3'-pyrophosphohydrolase, partial [Candidatus Uhrbacteria bacterium]|nr:bifunctional (p)ppGpp synthetase/guanosine-3',5'-bis(diphosphate) 3'-pyrophosphohydrolase [Candidatus Uhrbacteria bacterium]
MKPSFEKLEHLLHGYKTESVALVARASEFAERAHEGQLRESGVSYFHHTFATALILAEWRMPPAIIAAGFLHDVPEDTKFSLGDIEKNFGKDIASIVEGETKLSSLKYRGRERYAENLRKMFFAIAKDLRVVIVKFADRIDNLKTLDIFPEEKRRRIALETLEIYAPIANRLGMGDAKGQLEDLAFPHVYPKEHEWLTKLIEGKLEEKSQRMEKVQRIARDELGRAKIQVVNLHGRTKRLYSLYRKLIKRDRDLSRVYDLIALRVIVKTTADCYAVLGVIHNRFKPLKGRIKDYIAQPKPNGYRSLHTTVFSDDGEIVEFQVRTEEMHEDAEYGVAAHWRYDEGRRSAAPSARQLKWMEELARIQKELHDREAFLETVDELKIDFFKNRIFIFTPKLRNHAFTLYNQAVHDRTGD